MECAFAANKENPSTHIDAVQAHAEMLSLVLEAMGADSACWH
jgi:hypothetical protein